ncbi:MAG: hypothetical protein P8104_05190 [Gammaproteobacteria bacterium]
MTTDDFYFWLGLVSFFAMAISWISFARISMTAIEKRMAADGFPRPCLWDGVGARAFWIATAIAMPIKPEWDPTIDVATVRRYATRFDCRLGLVFTIAGFSFLGVILIGVVLGYAS